MRPSTVLFLLSLFFSFVLAQDYTCSSTKPCKLGCCSKTGVCGLGPDFCSTANCTSSCDQKSECDPGWGAQWSAKSKCPLNVCCSKFGFCGTTKDFCGDTKVPKPSCGGTSSNKRSIGYYEAWSMTRACKTMAPEQIPAGAYTHLNFAFAFIDPQTYKVAPMSAGDVDLYSRFTSLKEQNPGLQTWISVGGWSMNDPDQPTAKTFSNLAASSSAQAAFASSLISFMQTYGFDGVDIDWEYPGASERSGTPADFANYVSWLKNLRAAFGATGKNYGLTITLPSSYWYLQNFDIVSLEPLVDWLNIMTYDLHGTWDSTNRFIGPIVNAHTNLTEIDMTLDLFWRNNIKPANIVLGMGFYGRSFTLSSASCSSPGCTFSGGANPGPCSANAGTLMFSEIRDIIATGVTPTLNKEAAVKQLVWNSNQWVSYDDAETFKMKIDYANGKCLGGTMIWAVSNDDRNFTAAGAYQKNNGLVVKALAGGDSTPKVDVLTSCLWGDCGKNCPAGTVAAQRSDGKNRGNAGIYSFCPKGVTRNYCCPEDQEVPTCTWRGKAPWCKDGQCKPGEVQVASDDSATGSECWTNHKVLCCTRTASDASAGQCKWEGAAPFCGRTGKIGEHYGCDESDRQELTFDDVGAGGENKCYSGYKSFCCTQPPPYKNCEWTSRESPFWHPFTCPNGCPAGKQIVAQDPTKLSFCSTGSAFYCCDSTSEQIPESEENLNFCAALDDSYAQSDEFDEDGNPADIIEFYYYENEVFVVPNEADPDNKTPTPGKRSETIIQSLLSLRFDNDWDGTTSMLANSSLRDLPQVCVKYACFYIPPNALDEPAVKELLDEVRHGWDMSIKKESPYATETVHEYVKRASRKALVKLPRNKRIQFLASTYYTVAELAGAGRKFWGGLPPKTKNICVKYAASFGARQAVKYVTEHVTELQTPAQFAQSMIDGKWPDTSSISYITPNYDWGLVFDNTNGGYVSMTWAQLGIAQPAGVTGDTPLKAIYNALGSKSAADKKNLLVCDAQTNSLKTSAWALHNNIISDKRWNAASPSDRLMFLNKLDSSLIPYMNSGDAQDALKYAYQVQQIVWKALDTAVAKGTIVGPSSTLTFASLHKSWYKNFLNEVSENIQIYYQARLNREIASWSGPTGAYLAYKAAARNTIIKNLNGRLNNVQTLAIAMGWIL